MSEEKFEIEEEALIPSFKHIMKELRNIIKANDA